MNLTLYEYILAMTGSFIAGAINTLAGNGSVITLSILTGLIGLPVIWPTVQTESVSCYRQLAAARGSQKIK